jgi:hypothetical protein
VSRREVAIIALVGLVLLSVYVLRRQHEKGESVVATPSATATASAVEGPTSPSEPNVGPVVAAANDAAPASTHLVTAKWGSRRGELGHNRPQEGNPEGPMSFAATRDGLVVLDQVNGRLVRYDKNGQVKGSHTIADTVQDVAVGKDGTVALLDRLGEKNVTLTDANGKPIGKLPLGTGDTGLITGVFVDGNTVYVEEGHGGLTGIGTTDGQPLSSPTTLGGRPTKDGTLLVTGSLAGNTGQLTVNAIDRASGTLRYARVVGMPKPSLMIVLLDSDDRGVVYAGVAAGSPEAANVACLDPTDGHVIGRVVLPMSSEPEESFRDFSVEGDGTIVYALRTAEGVDYATAHCP